VASILPNQIIPEAVPFVNDDGTNNHNWWLFLYNLGQQVLGNSGSTAAAFAAQVNADLDADVDQTDSLYLVRRVANLEKQISDALPDPIDSRALLLAQDGLLADAAPRAQPVIVLTPGVSPWVYQATADGTLVLVGGTVSLVGLSRDGTTFYTVPQGAIPMSRLDQVKTTYTVVPTNAVFFPR
jgi:hypothetical protein